jgi:hypothetical protein
VNPILPPLPAPRIEILSNPQGQVPAVFALPPIAPAVANFARVLDAPSPPRIYSQGRHVTPWYPMRVLPCADRPGLYEVQWTDEPESMEYWDGKRWPALIGKFKATGWRGMAHAPATT